MYLISSLVKFVGYGRFWDVNILDFGQKCIVKPVPFLLKANPNYVKTRTMHQLHQAVISVRLLIPQYKRVSNIIGLSQFHERIMQTKCSCVKKGTKASCIRFLAPFGF